MKKLLPLFCVALVTSACTRPEKLSFSPSLLPDGFPVDNSESAQAGKSAENNVEPIIPVVFHPDPGPRYRAATWSKHSLFPQLEESAPTFPSSEEMEDLLKAALLKEQTETPQENTPDAMDADGKAVVLGDVYPLPFQGQNGLMAMLVRYNPSYAAAQPKVAAKKPPKKKVAAKKKAPARKKAAAPKRRPVRWKATDDTPCGKIPVQQIWREFAPFFNNEPNEEFHQFASIFLAIWERESRYAFPTNGVHVAPNCGNWRAVFIRALPGKDIKTDLRLAKTKDDFVKNRFPKCTMSMADYGPLQWNHHWRLSRPQFRPLMEEALAHATTYKKSEIKKLPIEQLSALVRYNPRALFVMGGIWVKERAHEPQKLIASYNTNPKYRTEVKERRNEMLELLGETNSCIKSSQVASRAGAGAP